MLRRRLLPLVILALALGGCSAGIVEINQRPTKYYQETVSFRGRVSRLQQLPGEVLLEVADLHEHRILVRAPAPVDVSQDEWVSVKGVLVPEARVGGRVIYDVVMAESIGHSSAPWFGKLF